MKRYKDKLIYVLWGDEWINVGYLYGGKEYLLEEFNAIELWKYQIAK